METLVMRDWGHSLDDKCFDGFENDADFKIDEFLNFDFWETDCLSWSHDLAQNNNNGSQYSSSTSDLPSIDDEDLMQIEDSPYESGESVFQLDCGVNGMEPVHHDSISGSSNISMESSETHNGSTFLDGSGLIPLSSDSAEYKGLRLVHLLNTCAEAMSDGAHDLVEMILCRLKELVSPTGSTMERVAYYLAQSLNRRHYTSEDQRKRPYSSISREDFLGAFRLLNQVYPYTRIAHFTANQSILESIPARAQNVHIIDFDIMEGLQWPPLMEALKSENYKIGHLKITAVKWYDDEEEDFSPSSSCSGAHDTGRRLSEYAYSLGIPFSFHQVDLVNVNSKLRGSNDEIIIVNSMWDLPHMYQRGKKRLVEFLQVSRCLNPSLLAIGAGPRGTESHGNLNLVERFSQCLTNLCAVFDSSEAGLTDQYALARAMVERLFLGPMMCRPFNSMSFQEDSEWGSVIDIPRQCGFVEYAISPINIMYAELMVSCGEVGKQYRVECSDKNRLLLRWNSTCLTSVTTWKASL